jgi:apolipoprotein N-acyltransferase
MLLMGRIVAALLSGAMLAQAHSLHPLWPLAWAAPIPLLVAVIGASRGAALLCGAIAGAASGALMFDYLAQLSGPGPVIVIALLRAAIWAGAALATRAAAQALPAWAAVFVFPALMAGIETLLATVSPHGSAGAFAYSQMDFLPAIQVASLGGAPAITFVVMLFASAVALLLAKRAFTAALAPALIVAAALGFGYWRLEAEAKSESDHDLAGVALLAADQFEGIPMDWRTVWAGYAPLIERAADQDYRIVLLPEKIAFLGAQERELAVAQMAEIAARRDITLIFGADVESDDSQRYNRLYAIAGARAPVVYDKRHMIPGLESHFQVGAGSAPLGATSPHFGYAICKDMDFPALGRDYAGAEVVFAPAWDFGVDAWLHARMAMLRGVENGYAVVRSAREGALTVSDAYGRVLAEARSGPLTSFNAYVPVEGPGPTLYARIGDVFGWACLALAALLMGWSFWAARRSP